MSSVTKIWPSQFDEDPIPIVGIFKKLVINFAVLGVIHSKTIENAPAFYINLASLINLLISFLFLPSTLNLSLNCGV